MLRVMSRFSRFGRKQDGNATLEFVLLLPIFIGLFMTGFESGYYLVRGVMLERATDIATRNVRLGNGQAPAYAALKQRICAEALIIPDCNRMLQVEVRPIQAKPGGVSDMSKGTRCVDKDATQDALNGTIYDTGSGNQLMMVRVCALADPLFPTTPVGAGLASLGDGSVALIARGGFVNEPGNGPGRASVGSYSVGNAGDGSGYGSDGGSPGNASGGSNGGSGGTSGSTSNGSGGTTGGTSGGGTTSGGSGSGSGGTSGGTTGGSGGTSGGSGSGTGGTTGGGGGVVTEPTAVDPNDTSGDSA